MKNILDTLYNLLSYKQQIDFFGCLLSICLLKLFLVYIYVKLCVYSQNKLVVLKHNFCRMRQHYDVKNPVCDIQRRHRFGNFLLYYHFMFFFFIGKRIFGSLLLFLYNKLMIIFNLWYNVWSLIQYSVRRFDF